LEWGTLSVAESGEKEFSKPRHLPIKTVETHRSIHNGKVEDSGGRIRRKGVILGLFL
jgi:hypothetical protein